MHKGCLRNCRGWCKHALMCVYSSRCSILGSFFHCNMRIVHCSFSGAPMWRILRGSTSTCAQTFRLDRTVIHKKKYCPSIWDGETQPQLTLRHATWSMQDSRSPLDRRRRRVAIMMIGSACRGVDSGSLPLEFIFWLNKDLGTVRIHTAPIRWIKYLRSGCQYLCSLSASVF